MRHSAKRISLLVAIVVAGCLTAGCGGGITSSISSVPTFSSRSLLRPGGPDMAPDPTKLRLRLDNVLARGAGWATQRGRGARPEQRGTAYPTPTPSMSAAGVMSGRRSMRNELPRPRREAMAGTSSAI
jgi:hypothetical protein